MTTQHLTSHHATSHSQGLAFADALEQIWSSQQEHIWYSRNRFGPASKSSISSLAVLAALTVYLFSRCVGWAKCRRQEQI